MSASGKSVCSQDSEWLPTGTSWITFGRRSIPDRAGNIRPMEPHAKLLTYPAKHATFIAPKANTSFTTLKRG